MQRPTGPLKFPEKWASDPRFKSYVRADRASHRDETNKTIALQSFVTEHCQ